MQVQKVVRKHVIFSLVLEYESSLEFLNVETKKLSLSIRHLDSRSYVIYLLRMGAIVIQRASTK